MKPSTALGGLAVSIALIAVVGGWPAPGTHAGPRDGLAREWAALPLAFEANRGQADPRYAFLARGAGYTIALRPTEVLLRLRGSAPLRKAVVGANPRARLVPQRRLPGKVNYLLGGDRSRWLRGISTYARLIARNVYPGIDLAYYGRQDRLEYDFLVHPGASPQAISLRFGGVEGVELEKDSSLRLRVTGGTLREFAPRVYQEVGGTRRHVDGRFVLRGDRVGFAVGAYDPNRTLVIDPTLAYSTYLGGNFDDEPRGIALDSAGNAFVAGDTVSTTFPTVGGYQSALSGPGDAFVAKLNASGTALIYSTYLGGGGFDRSHGIAVDSDGNAYVAGETSSVTYPTTLGAYQTSNAGGSDAFLTKLDASGSGLVYSTYLGGAAYDAARGVAVDSGGSAYVNGQTSGSDFPVTAGAYQTASGGGTDAFVTRFDPIGGTLSYSTYLGGSGNDISYGAAVIGAEVSVAGSTDSANFPLASPAFSYGGAGDAFVSRLDAGGGALIYSTYLGGSGGDSAAGVAADGAGNVYVTGTTDSGNLPLVNPYQPSPGGGVSDAFVAKIGLSGAPLYSTYLGGNGGENGNAITADGSGNAYVTGTTGSSNFPLANPYQAALAGGLYDGFLTKLDAGGTALAFSTYVGGNDKDWPTGIAADSSGSAHLTGKTTSTNFPTTLGAFQGTKSGFYDGFIAKLTPPPPTAVTVESFAVLREGRTVLLRWQTASEANVAGFDVYAGSKQLNPKLIRAKHAGKPRGASYSFRTTAGRAPYRLRLVHLDGSVGWQR